VPFGSLSADALIRVAGSVEQLSSHLLGRTLALEAQRRVGSLPLPTNFREVPGRGIEAELDGRQVLVGSPRFLVERLGTSGPPQPDGPAGLAAYVAIDAQPAGVVRFDDQLRPGVAGLMRRLAHLGVRRTVMLTGDNAANAAAIGAQAGIMQVEANLLPEDKVRRLVALQAEYAPVVMVGDGINDAPALATATVGVAMGARGTGIAAEAADIVLLVDDVAKVGEAVAIGQQMLRIAKQSIYLGLGLSFACMVAASLGYLPPVAGALLQEAIDVAVILNALRALGGHGVTAMAAPERHAAPPGAVTGLGEAPAGGRRGHPPPCTAHPTTAPTPAARSCDPRPGGGLGDMH